MYYPAWLILSLFIYVFTSPLQAQKTSPEIRLNQEGFYVDGPKFAILAGEAKAEVFFIINLVKRDTVFRGVPGPLKKSNNSSLICRSLDFSAVNTPGTYHVIIPGFGYSYPFVISEHPYLAQAIASLKAYYFQRVSMPLEPAFAGKWNRPAGHPDNQVLVHPSASSAQRPAGTIISSPGGWYDAGDYNKYIVNSGITMGTLLSAYEDFPAFFDTLKTTIPESGNEVPDILDEVLYNLRWMLTMQDPGDGGVYHKCTNADFDGMVVPGVTTLPRYVVMKSTAAALDFTAVMAQASRILKSFGKKLPGLSDSCQKAADQAWNWAIKNPSILYRQDEMNKMFNPAITTGAYGDPSLSDEWFWAAAEMYINKGQKVFLEKIDAGLKEPISLVSWNSVSMAGWYSLVRNEKKLPDDFPTAILKKRIIHFADSLLNNASLNAFQTVMGGSQKDFIWGSSAVAANQAIVLVNAYLQTKNSKYLDGAISNADYILGRNATGYCFVTGAGSKSPMHPHHRPSIADQITEPIPGLLSGGPNPGKQDGCKYTFSEPETSFLDDDCSYASNEIAINWNAPLVYLLNSLEYLKSSK